MDAITVLGRIKGVTIEVPESDKRAKVGPLAFLVSLVFSFTALDHKRSLESIRQSVVTQTGTRLARSTFWQRLSSQRLITHLLEVLGGLLKVMATIPSSKPLQKMAEVLGVSDIVVYDSSSITLPSSAKDLYPATRTNVIPSAFKWHFGLSLVSGLAFWSSMTSATVHDSRQFPPFYKLRGRLIIFDLGYWGFELFNRLIEHKALFLTRVKAGSSIVIDQVVEGMSKTRFKGADLFNCINQRKKSSKIIDLFAIFGSQTPKPLRLRVLGFWNKQARCYHWYVTNLSVPAKLIYPLYRARWQIELAFRACKGSFRVADMSSANPNIITALLLANIIATVIAFPLAKANSGELAEEKVWALSLQRAAKALVLLSGKIKNFILKSTETTLQPLIDALKLLENELYDPNYKRRSSTAKEIMGLALT